MDFSQLGVAGIVCALLLAALGIVWNRMTKLEDKLTTEREKHALEIKELNQDIREMEIENITTTNKYIEIQNKIYELIQRNTK